MRQGVQRTRGGGLATAALGERGSGARAVAGGEEMGGHPWRDAILQRTAVRATPDVGRPSRGGGATGSAQSGPRHESVTAKPFAQLAIGDTFKSRNARSRALDIERFAKLSGDRVLRATWTSCGRPQSALRRVASRNATCWCRRRRGCSSIHPNGRASRNFGVDGCASHQAR